MIKSESMIWREAIFSDSEAMVAGGVSFIFCPAVLRVLFGEGEHIFVAESFSKDRGGGDICIFSVALDDTLVRDRECCTESIAVDSQELGLQAEVLNGLRHALEGGVEDIYFVYARGTDWSDCPAEGLAADNLAEEVSVFLTHLLRVVKQGVVEIGRQDNCGGKNRSGKASTPRLVAARLKQLVLIKIWQHEAKLLFFRKKS